MRLYLKALITVITLSFCVHSEVVKIGAIFFTDENDLETAFDIAVDDINKLEHGVSLEVIRHFLREDDSLVLQNFACSLVENGVTAIFGPSSKAKSDIVEVICNMTGIPHLQFDWHGEDLQVHRLNHQMTLNLAPLQRNISEAYFDVLRTKPFSWTSFTIVYEQSSNMDLLQHLFASKEFYKNGIRIKEFKRGDDYRVLWKYISTSREKYVVLECPPDILTEVVNASIYFNMTGPFNHLFLTNLDTHTSGLEVLYSQKFTLSIAAARVRTYVPPQLHSEMDVFEDVEEEKIATLRSQLLYDAVVLYYNAIRNIILNLRYYEPQCQCTNGFWKPGPEVIAEMKMLTFKDVTPAFKTQKVQFNSFGDRDDFNLDIYNPMIDLVTHVWNAKTKLVDYDKLSENSTKRTERRKTEEKKDYSKTRTRFRVATRIGSPYFMYRPEPEGVHYEGNERFEGYAVDLIYKLGEKCAFDFDFDPVSDNSYGIYDPISNEWNGIIRQLIDNTAQIGICDLTITQARRSVVDFTVPFMQLGISVLYFKPKPPPKNLFGFLEPYSLKVWIYLLICVMLVSLGSVLVGRLSEDEWVFKEDSENNGIVVENIWKIENTFKLSLGAILNQGCVFMPRSTPLRLFIVFWWIFAIIMSQTYIAKMASFITSSKMEGSIRNLHDLIDQSRVQYGTVKGGSTSSFFRDSNETHYRKAWSQMKSFKPDAFTDTNEQGVKRVLQSGGKYAFLMETSNLQYSLLGNPDLIPIGDPFGEKHYGIAVPKNADYRSNLSVCILKLGEIGTLYSLKQKWFTDNHTKTRNKKEVTGDSFTMDQLGGLFYVLVSGMILGYFVGIGEFLWNAKRISIREQIPYSVIVKAELAFFVRFWKNEKPLRTYLISRGSTSTGYSSCDQELTTSSKLRKRNKARKKKS